MPRRAAAFFALAFAMSWAPWGAAIAVQAGPLQTVLFHAGGFGPLCAALILSARAGTLAAWLRRLAVWRVSPGWYAFALLWPAFLALAASALYAALGHELAPFDAGRALTAYLPTLLATALIGGGNEEPGWRGYALPLLQDRLSPAAATLMLGLVWALWHLPLLGLSARIGAETMAPGRLALVTAITVVSITLHAFWYTWLWNRTASLLICVLLHAGYNTANSLLVLIPAPELTGPGYLTPLLIMTGLLGVSVALLLSATRGRLGREPQARSGGAGQGRK